MIARLKQDVLLQFLPFKHFVVIELEALTASDNDNFLSVAELANATCDGDGFEHGHWANQRKGSCFIHFS